MNRERYVNSAGWSDFVNLVKEGDEGEKICGAWLLARGNTDLVHIDEAMKEDDTLTKSDWDWKFKDKSGNVKYIEVKTQNYCHEHQGVNIEETQSGIESGIKVSLSDYYVFVNPEWGFGIVSTDYLRAISNGGAKGMKRFRTRAKNPATGFILPHCHILWIN